MPREILGRRTALPCQDRSSLCHWTNCCRQIPKLQLRRSLHQRHHTLYQPQRIEPTRLTENKTHAVSSLSGGANFRLDFQQGTHQTPPTLVSGFPGLSARFRATYHLIYNIYPHVHQDVAHYLIYYLANPYGVSHPGVSWHAAPREN